MGLHDFAAFCRHRGRHRFVICSGCWSRAGTLVTARHRRRVLLVDGAVVGGKALLAVGEHRRATTWCHEAARDRTISDFAVASARRLTLVRWTIARYSQLASRNGHPGCAQASQGSTCSAPTVVDSTAVNMRTMGLAGSMSGRSKSWWQAWPESTARKCRARRTWADRYRRACGER